MMTTDMSGTACARALSHVAALPSGGPVDPGLRVTLNFHPDRLVGDLAILERLAKDGVYLGADQVSRKGATAGPQRPGAFATGPIRDQVP
ncbi:hypothetical protein ABZV14_38420 [Streptosporangium canum]|uniref:hypothetical protein n=1 Tax=Streptosporangium canum TaxID=324952 RepID=UPI0033AFD8F7